MIDEIVPFDGLIRKMLTEKNAKTKQVASRIGIAMQRLALAAS